MRKLDRDGLIELISSMNEAMDYLQIVNGDEAGTLYEDCKEAILSILKLLNSQLSQEQKISNKAIMGSLEDAVQIFDYGKFAPIPNEFYEIMKQTFSKLKEELDIIKVQYEIVFLPYNVTMWDSLESIWLAANEDPNCIAYVIPIPYFDKTEDGLLGQMHYDGNLFPEYVPITDYLQYDLEKRRPEVIYFHNPYDKFNRVTSVHPMFYSDKLRNYTDMLIYVPYFMVMDYLSEDFAILPGVRYADKVIVQSEDIAEQYKNYYPGTDKDKFIPLGSPKMDKVYAMSQLTREELNLPEEWKQRIGDKKVVLYNTHLDHIMNRGEELIKKLRYVFACFENRDDVVLLWRPHPFSDNTAITMNPKILEEYRQLEQEFSEKKIGIYDNTPDLHRSLALADAYYGDWSSLVPMFGATGKPVMIQDINMFNNDLTEHNEISFCEAFFDGERLWFSANEYNGLFYINLKTEKVKHISNFPNEKMEQKNLYNKVAEYNGKLFFIPTYANELAEYNFSTNSFTKIPLSVDSYSYKYNAYVLYLNWLYLFPLNDVPCLRVNMDTREVFVLDNWNNEIKNYKLKTELGFSVITSAYLLSGKIYVTFGLENIILEYDIEEKCFTKYTLKECTGYTHIQYDGENFWLLPRKKASVLRWNPQNKNEEYFNDYSFKYELQKMPFSACYTHKKMQWLFARLSPQIIQLDVRSMKKIKEIGYHSIVDSGDLQREFFSNVIPYNKEEIIAYPGNSKLLMIINVETNDMRVITINTDDKLKNEKLNIYIKENTIFNQNNEERIEIEKQLFSLKDFILDVKAVDNNVSSWHVKLHRNYKQVLSIGLRIHKYIISIILGSGSQEESLDE